MGDQKRVSELDSLSKEQRENLLIRLHKAQNDLCYVCQGIINLQVHKTDIDHIVALARGGKDDESNWALTHDSCNRSKGTRDLHLQRILHEFRDHVQKYTNTNAQGHERNFTLNEALLELKPNRQEVGVKIEKDRISISWTEENNPSTETYPLLEEPADPPAVSFVARVPMTCIHHDQEINPRSIVDLEPMIEEFYNGYPQLQPSLATISICNNEGRGKILVFDGQHKAAAQIYARRNRIFLRVFVNYDRDRLKETNYRAHTKLAQVRFPQLVNDRVGADLFKEEFTRFIQGQDLSKVSEDTFFKKHIPHIQKSEYKHYFKNYLRYEALIGKANDQQNTILDFTETVMPRSIRYPLSYDTLQRTFFELMLFKKPAHESIEQSEKYREIEKQNLIRLLVSFVDEVLSHNRFDLNLGIRRMEERLVNDPQSIPDSHLRAYRLCRRSAMVIWVNELKRAIQLLLNTKMRYMHGDWAEKRPLWAEIHDEDWAQISRMIRAIRDHKVWGERVSTEIVVALASTRQRDWEDILLKGTLPGRQDSLLPPLDQNYIFKSIVPG